MKTSEYSFLVKLLHRISVGSKTISEISFDIEKSIYYKNETNSLTNKNHVFISGLARSGTTALMQCLYGTKTFASLTYRDMPFVLAPNFWKKLAIKQKSIKQKERAHKDGIFINDKSPEALDEVFWKVFLNDDYIQSDRLLINNIPLEIVSEFEKYISLIILKNDENSKLRYLSKNNNNILRLNYILQKFPNSFVIIPFRDPLQQSLSLLNQHRHFCKIQTDNPFVLKYMNWLGHHEFGLNQKPFFLGNNKIFEQLLKYDKMDINYWLLNWLNYYSYVLANYSNRCILFSNERFCAYPNQTMNGLAQQLDLKNLHFNDSPYISVSRSTANSDETIVSTCMTVYNKMNSIV